MVSDIDSGDGNHPRYYEDMRIWYIAIGGWYSKSSSSMDLCHSFPIYFIFNASAHISIPYSKMEYTSTINRRVLLGNGASYICNKSTELCSFFSDVSQTCLICSPYFSFESSFSLKYLTALLSNGISPKCISVIVVIRRQVCNGIYVFSVAKSSRVLQTWVHMPQYLIKRFLCGYAVSMSSAYSTWNVIVGTIIHHMRYCKGEDLKLSPEQLRPWPCCPL